MPTTLAPSLGNGLLFTQQGVGVSPGYDMVDLRRASTAGLQEGVYAAGSFEVTQRAAGSAMFVDIAASTADNGIAALVQGDAVTGQGLYVIGPHSTFITEAIAASHATLPRVDRVILEVQDNLHDASGANAARVRVVTGTATAGATLDNLNGAAAVPSSALLLADVLIVATDTAITNSEIRDRRKWARGAFWNAVGNGGANSTTTSASLVTAAAITAKRLECSGAPVEVTITGCFSGSGGGPAIGVMLDGVGVGGLFASGAGTQAFAQSWVITPSAGSHTFAIGLAASSGTATLVNTTAAYGGGPAIVPSITVREIPRQNTTNNATTSG